MLQIAGVSKGHAKCTHSVNWCYLVYRNIER
jgi:hypothetical protein